MRVLLLAAVATATLVTASPALAQQNPGLSASQRAYENRASTRNEFATDVSEFQRMNAKDRAKFAAKYRSETEPFKANALQIAAQAQAPGVELPADAAVRIRAALEADMVMWKNSFRLSKKEWQAWSDQWLVDASKLSGAQWAAHRANWFAARDSWIDKMVAGER